MVLIDEPREPPRKIRRSGTEPTPNRRRIRAEPVARAESFEPSRQVGNALSRARRRAKNAYTQRQIRVGLGTKLPRHPRVRGGSFALELFSIACQHERILRVERSDRRRLAPYQRRELPFESPTQRAIQVQICQPNTEYEPCACVAAYEIKREGELLLAQFLLARGERARALLCDCGLETAQIGSGLAAQRVAVRIHRGL